MLAENERRAHELLARLERRDDYGTLLMQGEVGRRLSEVEDPDEWRANLRVQARQDRIRIATGITDKRVFAVLRNPSEQAISAETKQWLPVIHRAVDAARDRGHEWDLVRDGQEGVLACRRCRCRGYVNATDDVIDGELFETPCDD